MAHAWANQQLNSARVSSFKSSGFMAYLLVLILLATEVVDKKAGAVWELKVA